MKKLSLLLVFCLIIGLVGCSTPAQTPQIIATTKPVYDFTTILCEGTDLSVGLLISENVSCLHDYSLTVAQARMVEGADTVILSGAGLESFMSDLLAGCDRVIDSSAGISLLECTEEHDHGHDHHHEEDAHIWLDPMNAKKMTENICQGLCEAYPEYADTIRQNLYKWEIALNTLQVYGNEQLADLSCRELVTFHDGFGYFAQAFDLTIAAAVEEESGSETSAKELIHLIELIRERNIPAVFTETNGSTSAAKIITAETGISSYTLDMGMSDDYLTIMRRNILAVKEALG